MSDPIPPEFLETFRQTIESTAKATAQQQADPLASIRETLAEGTGLLVAARAVGLQNHFDMLSDARRRLEDSHRMHLHATGFQAGPAPGQHQMEGDEFMPGNVSVAGDTTNNHFHMSPSTPAPSAPIQPPTTRPPSPSGGELRKGATLGQILPWALAAALGGSSLASFFRPTPTPSPKPVDGTDRDTRYELTVTGTDAPKRGTP